jgi:RNA polymerase sigma-70 factor (ECF subfamily)
MDQSDAEVVERARGGDRIAIGELFSRYWRAARAAAFGVTGEVASAEDAAADAFREAWAGLDSLRDPDRFGPWLRTIVVRTARKARRRGPPAHDVSIDELPALNQAADSALERLEAAALVRHFVRELPPRVREAVSLFYFEGYDSDDAARFLAIPPGDIPAAAARGPTTSRCPAHSNCDRFRSCWSG